MSTKGKGYGSEDHLRSSLSKDCQRLNRTILNQLSQDGCALATAINWHQNYLTIDSHDGELRGMDFLQDAGGELWKKYWPDPKAGMDPQRHGTPNWDAVGSVVHGDQTEWLLVEAKAHTHEFEQSPKCGAGNASRIKITEAFQKTRLNMGLTSDLNALVPESWFEQGSYQIANRFAALNFLLHETNTLARLLFVYYINDRFPGKICPPSVVEWQNIISKQYARMGIGLEHKFKSRTHYLFVDLETKAV